HTRCSSLRTPARRAIMSSSHPPSSPARVVLVAAIASEADIDTVVMTAAGLGQTISGAELHLVHAVPTVAAGSPEVAMAVYPTAPDVIENARHLLEAASLRAHERFTGDITLHFAVGDPRREILHLTRTLEADVVVVGMHRKRRLERLIEGSVAEHVV